MYEQFKDRANFLTIYIREAHPQNEWQMKENLKDDVCYMQPHSLEGRGVIGNDFVRRFHYPVPFGIDGMDDTAMKQYAAWPERVYIIGEDGKIAYKGGIGPGDYHPEQAEAWLKRRFPDVALRGGVGLR